MSMKTKAKPKPKPKPKTKTAVVPARKKRKLGPVKKVVEVRWDRPLPELEADAMAIVNFGSRRPRSLGRPRRDDDPTGLAFEA